MSLASLKQQKKAMESNPKQAWVSPVFLDTFNLELLLANPALDNKIW